jgi:hypothetical protein
MEGIASQVSLDTQNNVTEELISEPRLWTAVLVNAVEDWRGGTLGARREAQEFLFESDADFEMVCAGVGLNAGDFRARLLKIGRRIEMKGPLPESRVEGPRGAHYYPRILLPSDAFI